MYLRKYCRLQKLQILFTFLDCHVVNLGTVFGHASKAADMTRSYNSARIYFNGEVFDCGAIKHGEKAHAFFPCRDPKPSDGVPVSVELASKEVGIGVRADIDRLPSFF
jgi:hypothetical protein